MFPSLYLLAPNVFAVLQISSALCFKTARTHFIQPTRASFRFRQVRQQFTHSTLEMLFFFLYESADSSCLKRSSSLDFITNIFSVLCVLNLTVVCKRLMGWKGKKNPVISAVYGIALISPDAMFESSFTPLPKKQVLYWQWQFQLDLSFGIQIVFTLQYNLCQI